jgi:hypothetical protein
MKHAELVNTLTPAAPNTNLPKWHVTWWSGKVEGSTWFMAIAVPKEGATTPPDNVGDAVWVEAGSIRRLYMTDRNLRRLRDRVATLHTPKRHRSC